MRASSIIEGYTSSRDVEGFARRIDMYLSIVQVVTRSVSPKSFSSQPSVLITSIRQKDFSVTATFSL